ncbi:MAG TPA: pyridoxamine 5'-phosphate oxidase family protein [Burkholderiaceae bacterium]|nr:pyridoxamine 5'-phosphate oxidase family protein [Burkholderiaceae bacterium]
MNQHEHRTITDPIEARTTLWNLIKDIHFAMFTTSAADGHLHSRPMTTQNSNLDEDSNLWFFMSRSGDAVADLTTSKVVNVAYADTDADRYVSVAGHAAVVDDAAKKQALWSKLAEAWFPGGPSDPDLALVRVRIAHANYWDVKSSKIVQLYKMAKAAVTGKPPTDLGEQAEIRMN